MKRAVLRPVAERDLIDATRWYIGQGGLALEDINPAERRTAAIWPSQARCFAQ